MFQAAPASQPSAKNYYHQLLSPPPFLLTLPCSLDWCGLCNQEPRICFEVAPNLFWSFKHMTLGWWDLLVKEVFFMFSHTLCWWDHLRIHYQNSVQQCNVLNIMCDTSWHMTQQTRVTCSENISCRPCSSTSPWRMDDSGEQSPTLRFVCAVLNNQMFNWTTISESLIKPAESQSLNTGLWILWFISRVFVRSPWTLCFLVNDLERKDTHWRTGSRGKQIIQWSSWSLLLHLIYAPIWWLWALGPGSTLSVI